MKKDKPAKLSISNICYFTLVIFIWTSYIAQANHIIFENVGSMAGAISYIHAKITINISAVEEQWVSYRNHLEGFVDKLEEPSKDQWSTHYYETNLYKLELQHYKTLTRVLNLYLTNSLDIQTDIHHHHHLELPILLKIDHPESGLVAGFQRHCHSTLLELVIRSKNRAPTQQLTSSKISSNDQLGS